ncbi:MAG: hypothetical protein JWL77_3741 [Chthonomonadaceae bacterium]|nr:hypothetical protein [Chthonomonadaceae bacterium]
MKHVSILFAFLLALLSVTNEARGEPPIVIGMAQLHRLDLLPAFKQLVTIGAVTSYDRSGGNDDGFSGKYSFVRKEGDNLVLADLKGPGCIYRIHTPTPTDDLLEFYFDGETTPRIRTTFRKLFSGTESPFLKPLVDYAGGGYYCYVPMPYQQSCKLLLHAKTFQFYDLNYATYPSDAPIATFDPKATAADTENLDRAIAVFNMFHPVELTDFTMPAGTALQRKSVDADIKPGQTRTIFEAKKGGRIAALKLGPAEAFAGRDRDVLLKVTWDGDKKPAILCPVGDFFGYGWGKPAVGARFVGTREGMNYCYLPMPYDRSAKIELISLKQDGTTVHVRGEVTVGNRPRMPEEGKFYAVWRRENPTTTGKPFTFFESQGRGHIVGLALQSQGMKSGSTEFFEGDDVTTVDGAMVVHGTGSEDFFNGGWYDVPDRWDAPVARALSGCMDYKKPLGRTGAYRFFIGDAYSYRNSILQTIEHGPEGNAVPTDYCSVTYLYSENRPTVEFEIPTLAQRQVVDPVNITFTVDWTVPINSFAFANATVSRREVPTGSGQKRCLSFRASKKEDFFGPPFLSMTFDLPATGKYKVYVDVVKGPEQALMELCQDELPVGPAIDLYREKPEIGSHLYLGDVLATEGNNRLMFKLVGKNDLSKAFGLDLIDVTFVKIP